ncbi:hypothetical protein AYJ54_18540 [Bradyrhizobium centrolobii]|uniref:Uncharacterized protein n=1 Tax=Bradyrhizobium centrolobii TaxID=1505087 RepID=A0A176YJA4_9BRAD|nr:hypothetical protein AYJ54_18540 [Bradyrhizobium centrolobii]
MATGSDRVSILTDIGTDEIDRARTASAQVSPPALPMGEFFGERLKLFVRSDLQSFDQPSALQADLIFSAANLRRDLPVCPSLDQTSQELFLSWLGMGMSDTSLAAPFRAERWLGALSRHDKRSTVAPARDTSNRAFGSLRGS